ncbi:MAG TPA: MFS transporter [Gaiellaceae bacterium]
MPTNRQIRVSLTAIFASTGFFVGSWASRIPAVKSEFHLSPARLGLLLACMTLGAVAGSPLAGYASARFGSRSLLRVAAPIASLAFAGIALAPSIPLLAGAMFLSGAANGHVQVSMNAQAIALEGRYRRTILSTMHGGFSVGMMAGALVAALVAHFNISYHAHLLVVAAVLLAIALTIGFFLIETDPVPRTHRRRLRLSLPLAVIIAVAFFELFCEGTASSWSSVYMHDSIGASSAIAALTFGLYSLTMTVGRLWGDRLVLRMGVGGLVRAGGLLALCGMGLALAVRSPLIVLIGFALFGLGLSCQAPTLFRAAGQLPLPEGQGLAAVMAAAWPAFLLVAPVIGGLASITSLRAALLVSLGAAGAMVVLSGGLGRLAPAPLAPAVPEPD